MSVEQIKIGDPHAAFFSGVGVAPARGVQFLREWVDRCFFASKLQSRKRQDHC
jgi:hypothetical protein